jgi:hypothetical protein
MLCASQYSPPYSKARARHPRHIANPYLIQAGDATTYLVTCPTTVASADCGIPGKGMTAIAAPSSAELYQAYGDGR